jgi:hypothetical protein
MVLRAVCAESEVYYFENDMEANEHLAQDENQKALAKNLANVLDKLLPKLSGSQEDESAEQLHNWVKRTMQKLRKKNMKAENEKGARLRHFMIGK